MRTLFAAIIAATLMVGAAHAKPDEKPPGDEQPELTRPEFGDRSSPIRPGANMGGVCTYNFVFYRPVPAPQLPPVYIGTAGHCTSKVGDRVTLGTSQQIGTVAYDSDVAGSEVDFSLIRIDPELVSKTNPTVLGWGGPNGSAGNQHLAVGDRVDLYGHGMVLGQNSTTRARWGVLVNWTDYEYVADMPAVNGDSGAPVLHDPTGRALGIVSRYGITAMPPSTDIGPRMGWILQELGRAGFSGIVLANAE